MGYLVDIRDEINRKPVIGWDNRLLSASMSGSGAASGFSRNAARTYATYEGWRTASGTGVLTATVGQPFALGYVGVMFMSAPDGAVAQLLVDGDPVSYSVPASGAVMWLVDIDDASIITVQVSGLGSTGYIANLSAGPRLEGERSIYVGHTPITMGREETKFSGLSESGQYLGTIQRRASFASQVEMTDINPDFYRKEMEPFIRQIEQRPHYFAWRSVIPGTTFVGDDDGTILVDDDGTPVNFDPAGPRKEVGYITVPNAHTTTNTTPNGMMSVSWPMTGVAER